MANSFFYSRLYTWLKYELSVNEVAPPLDAHEGLTMFMPPPSPFQHQPNTVQPLPFCPTRSSG